MLPIPEILAYLNEDKKPEDYLRRTLNKWRNLYFGMSLHTSGAAPAFMDLSYDNMAIPVGGIGITAPVQNVPYSSYLSSLKSLGFDYINGWIFPPNYQGVEYQFIFDKIIFSRHPREPWDIRMWRFSQYVPITQGVCGALNEVVTGAIFQDSNYTIQLEDTEDEEYISSNSFQGYDLVGYVSNIAYKNIVEDANGYTLRIPKFPWNQQPEGKLPVDIWFINSKDICFLPPDEDFIIFSKHGYGWYIDKQVIWRFKYNYQNKKYELAPEDVDGYYKHDFGRMPMTKAGGVWNPQGYYEGYYYKAKPIMDDFCRTYSARQLVDKEASHPYIIEPDVDCPECNGKGQVQVPCADCPDGVDLLSCSACHGSGSISRNPGQHVVMPKQDIKDGVKVEFVSPDVAVNKNLRETVREMMDMILETLHLNKQKTDTVQSGLAKAIDQDRLYKFVSGISNDIFDKLIPDTLDDITQYRNLKPGDKKIVKPTQFQIKTSEDLLTELKTAQDANLPFYIRQKITLDYIDKEYSGDLVLKRKGFFITTHDPLNVQTVQEKTEIGNYKEIAYSKMISTWLDAIAAQKGNEWFAGATDKDLELEVEKLSTAYFTENPEPEQPDETIDINEERTDV